MVTYYFLHISVFFLLALIFFFYQQNTKLDYVFHPMTGLTSIQRVYTLKEQFILESSIVHSIDKCRINCIFNTNCGGYSITQQKTADTVEAAGTIKFKPFTYHCLLWCHGLNNDDFIGDNPKALTQIEPEIGILYEYWIHMKHPSPNRRELTCSSQNNNVGSKNNNNTENNMISNASGDVATDMLPFILIPVIFILLVTLYLLFCKNNDSNGMQRPQDNNAYDTWSDSDDVIPFGGGGQKANGEARF